MNTLKSKLSILIIGLFAFTSQVIVAQDLENETGFIYLKAKYLNETGRHDDAIREFNKVVKQIADYEDALILRADSKYALAAYQGAANDALEYIKLKGATPEAVLILAKTQYMLENKVAAKNSFLSSARLSPNDPTSLEFLAKLAMEDDELLSACEYWTSAAKLGSTKAAEKLQVTCGQVVKPVSKPKDNDVISIGNQAEEAIEDKPKSEEVPVKEQTEKKKEDLDLINGKPIDTEVKDKQPTEDPITVGTKEKEEEIEENDDPIFIEDPDLSVNKDKEFPVETIELKQPEDDVIVDDTSNDIKIDEDLTLHIYGQGIGKRKIMKTPNILILSEDDGKVAIDICLNKKGQVETAEFNPELSTISKKSLISLAIRKSKEFVFENLSVNKQCGVIIFDIKGS